jgi:hypothetical protein
MARRAAKRKRNPDGTLAPKPTSNPIQPPDDHSIDDVEECFVEHDDYKDASYSLEPEDEEADTVGAGVEDEGGQELSFREAEPPVKKS